VEVSTLVLGSGLPEADSLAEVRAVFAPDSAGFRDPERLVPARPERCAFERVVPERGAPASLFPDVPLLEEPLCPDPLVELREVAFFG
jgi:hypothetical protein